MNPRPPTAAWTGIGASTGVTTEGSTVATSAAATPGGTIVRVADGGKGEGAVRAASSVMAGIQRYRYGNGEVGGGRPAC